MINYTDSIQGIEPDQLKGFFVGWPNPPSPETHLKILRQSTYKIIAIDSQTGAVVGFINSISDKMLCAYIPLLEVLPSYQGRGIGGELVKRMLSKLQNFYMIDITCDKELQPFYEKYGLVKSTGMMKRNFARQSGTRQ